MPEMTVGRGRVPSNSRDIKLENTDHAKDDNAENLSFFEHFCENQLDIS